MIFSIYSMLKNLKKKFCYIYILFSISTVAILAYMSQFDINVVTTKIANMGSLFQEHMHTHLASNRLRRVMRDESEYTTLAQAIADARAYGVSLALIEEAEMILHEFRRHTRVQFGNSQVLEYEVETNESTSIIYLQIVPDEIDSDLDLGSDEGVYDINLE
jgi:hypothetical protein